MKFFFSALFVVAIVVRSVATFEVTGRLITLYNDLDKVVELTNANMTSTVYNSPQIWVVEFYNHWCGHCQKFVKVWKKVAEEFHDWRDIVRIGAINCAQQQASCNIFNIRGTPTIRIFYPGIATGPGVEIGNSLELSFNRGEILKSIEFVQSHQLIPIARRRNLLPFSSMDLNAVVSEALPAKKVVFVLEDVADHFGDYDLDPDELQSSGREILFLAEKKFPDFYIRRIDWMHASGIRNYFQGGLLPAVIVLDIIGNSVDWENMQVFYPISNMPGKTVTKQAMDYLETVKTKMIESGQVEIISTTTTTTPSSTTARSVTTTIQDTRPDVAHAVDLENSIRYALTVEIPTQQLLDEAKMKVIYQYLEIIIRYLPLRENIIKFLKALREWPIQMDLRTMTSTDFSQKVTELMNIHHPFDATPEDYIGCKGSQPHFRGYPCSVWTLFHALTVNAALKGDPAMAVGGKSSVAKAMVGYIHHFFSCRPCAENFATKVNHLGFLPTTPIDSIMWLWQIHNMANQVLKGDASEDPEHPKILWPSAAKCPECRTSNTWYSTQEVPILQAQGEYWNIKATSDYIMKTYKAENILPNLNETKVDKVEELQKLMELTMSKIESEEGRMNLDIKSLVAINQYCTKAFSLVKH